MAITENIGVIPAVDETGQAPAATPELFNTIFGRVQGNFNTIDPIIQDVVAAKGNEESLAARFGAIDEQLGALESSSAVSVSKALEDAWSESDEGFSFEMFRDAVQTWRDMTPVAVVQTVSGDDSVDVESTANLEEGASYVLFDGTHAETIVVSNILTTTRFQAAAPLTADRTGGTLARTNWEIHSGYASIPSGTGTFFSKVLSVLRYQDDGRLVIRRKAGDGELRVFARTAGETVWQAGEFIESQVRDDGTWQVRYHIPVGGRIELKIEALPASTAMRIESMMLLTSPQAGRADPVRQPVITSPQSGATGVMETPTITVDAYRSLYGLDQGGMRVRIYTDEDRQNLVYTGTETGAATSHTVAAGNLETDRVYWIEADLWDSENTYSPVSALIPITTGSVFQYVQQPRVVSPAAGAEVSQTNVTIVLDQMQVEAGGTGNQTAGRFLVASDLAGTNIVYDSGEVADLTSHVVTGDPLERGQTYYAFGLQKDETRGWSERSAGVRFSIQQIGNGVRVDGGVAVGPTTFADGAYGYLVVAPAECRVQRKWGLYDTDVSELSNISSGSAADAHTGAYNTQVLTSGSYNYINDGLGSVGAPAAEYCAGMLYEDCDDFFLMNQQEMTLTYNNLAAIDAADETAGTKLTGLSDYAWTSSEANYGNAWVRRFSDGGQCGCGKGTSSLVIPARRILI